MISEAETGTQSIGSRKTQRMRRTGKRGIRSFTFVLLTGAIAWAGPPFKTDDPQPVDIRHWEFYIASEQSFETHATEATCPHFEINYGAFKNTQLHIVAPLGYVRTENGTRYGPGDVEIGVKYRFVEETATVPQCGVFPLVEVPTGDESRQLGAGTVRMYIPLWLQKSWGKLTTYAGGGFWYNPGSEMQNCGFTGWEVQYDISDIVTLGGELYYQTADTRDGIAGRGFNVGGYLNVDENNHILFSFGRMLSGEASTTGYIGYQLTI